MFGLFSSKPTEMDSSNRLKEVLQTIKIDFNL